MMKIVRYVLSGVSATAASLLTTYILTDMFGVWYLFSSVAGFCIAISVSFTLQKFWTFRHTHVDRVHIEAAQFILVALGGLVFNAAAVYGLVEYAGIHYLLAQFLVGGFIALGNFVFYHMIFRGAARRSLKALWREELGDYERALIIAGGVAFFLVVMKFFGIELPYHQDEWKVAHFVVDPASMAGTFHHPPLTELLFRIAGWLIPAELLRMMPLAFTALSYGLLYLIIEARASARAAFLSLVLFGTVAYGTLAALMLDTDGAVLPFFMLCAVYAYDRFLESKGRTSLLFGALLLAALLVGLLVKLSFVLVVGAILLDYLYERRRDITPREAWRLGGALLVFLAVFAALFEAVRALNPYFDTGAMVRHALSYVQGFDRNWGQIAFQGAKALMYLGPLVLSALVFMSRDVFEKTRFFFIYLGLGLVFYLVLFDFSAGALDKYLMFLIVPLCAVVGVTLAPYLPKRSEFSVTYCAVLIFGGAALLAVNFLPHDVLPLYPKSAWAKEVLSLHWNVLLPFMGGSGPAGFYVSFLFIALSFVAGAALSVAAYFRESLRALIAGALLVLALLYAGVFTEELFFGRINGNTQKVIQEALTYVGSSESVTSVITYNDIGAYELWRMGKYTGRFYAAPQYEEEHQKLFAAHTGQYLVVDIPRWSDGSFYGHFFASCTSLFSSSSGAITARVYECPSTKMVQ
ncbi:MAG: GtrA family protein [bacterium]|nr:GtrA family protein [bacterium]